MKSILKSIYKSSGLSTFGLLSKLPDSLLYGFNYNDHFTQVSQDTKFLAPNLYKLFLYNQKYTDYGRDQFGSMKVHLEEVFEIYKTLPIITSDDLRGNLEYFSGRSINFLNSYRATTGGTGHGITNIVLSNSSYSQEWAHINEIWGRIGFDRKMHPRMSLRGAKDPKESLFVFNALYNEYLLNELFLTDSVLEQSIEFIQREGIEYIHLYPSNLEVLFNFCFNHSLKPKLKGIFTGSEGCSLKNRLKYRSYFNCPIVHWYGLSEKVVLASDEDCTGDFKVFTSYSFVSVENEINGVGEIVGSTFVNKALPLIKYATGDFGQVLYKDDYLIIRDVKGRWGKDFLFCEDGTKISSTQLNFHDEVFKYILYYQIVQNSYNQILVKILLKSEEIIDRHSLELALHNLFKNKLPNFSIQIVFSEIADFQLSARGKIKMIVQNLKQERALA
jgi:phenylacetate-CoA ligase